MTAELGAFFVIFCGVVVFVSLLALVGGGRLPRSAHQVRQREGEFLAREFVAFKRGGRRG